MSEMDYLARLEAYRDALLVTEVVAWMHMLGKLDDAFLTGGRDVDLRPPADTPPDLLTLLQDPWPGQVLARLADAVRGFPKDDAAALTLASFMAKHRKARGGLPGLLRDAHGRGSGTEKPPIQPKTAPSGGCRCLHPHGANPAQKGRAYIARATGWEEAPPLTPEDLQALRRDLYPRLVALLGELKARLAARQPVDWDRWRAAFLQGVTPVFRRAVADTRRPYNDVTLLDQTVATVATFKAALAQVLLQGRWQEPHRYRYRWRFLRVGLDTAAWLRQAVRLRDLLSRRAVLEKALDGVRDLLEVRFPLGLEVYRDERGSTFLVPDLETLEDLPRWKDGQNRTLAEHLQAVADAHFQGELRFDLEFDAQPTRHLRPFGDLVGRPAPPPTPQVALLEQQWKQLATAPPPGQPNTRELCSVCGLRPQGPDPVALAQNVCRVCLERRLQRASAWAEAPTETVWLDEVADEHGRVALVVGRFYLEPWLTGEAFSTVLALDPRVRYDCLEKLAGELREHPDAPVAHWKQDWTCLGLGFLPRVASSAREVYTTYLEATDLVPDVPEALYQPWRLALAWSRQPPSPARIRRMWETTRAFWSAVAGDFPKTVGRHAPRLRLTGRPTPTADARDLRTYAAYVLRREGTALPVMWDGQGFILVVNHAYLAHRLGEDWQKALTGDWQVEEPVGYGAANRAWGEFHVEAVQSWGEAYVPAQVVLDSPRTFMALVPAQKALNVLHQIRSRYIREMARVRNRLPLRLGVVFAPRRVPLRAWLQAGQRLLDAPPFPQTEWVVEAVRFHTNGNALPFPVHPAFRAWVEVRLRRGPWRVAWPVPLYMADGETEDRWFPYVHLLASGDGSRPENRAAFWAPNPWQGDGHPVPWVHARDLRAGDRIHFLPSTVDFVWLGTAAERFRLAYDDATGQRLGLPHRPLLLDELQDLERLWLDLSTRLTSGQIYALRDLVEDRRRRWRVTWEEALREEGLFQDFCFQALANAEWQDGRPSESDLQAWAGLAAQGRLADMVELYMHILKQ